MTLFLIYNSDGETFVKITSDQEVIQSIEDAGMVNKFMPELTRSDTNYWTGPLLIRGEIVSPVAVETVKTYTIK